MPIFQKVATVDARKYEGPVLTVVNDQLGEQVATSGDYLVGMERGKVSVMSKAKFEAEFVPFNPTLTDEALEEAHEQLFSLRAELEALNLVKQSVDSSNQSLIAQNAQLIAAAEDVNTQKALVHSISVQLATVTEEKVLLKGQLDKLEALEKQESDAQATTDAAHAALLNTLTH